MILYMKLVSLQIKKIVFTKKLKKSRNKFDEEYEYKISR